MKRKPLNGRDVGVARSKLRTVIVPNGQPASAIERVELALAWFVNGDGIAFPSTATLQEKISENDTIAIGTIRNVSRRLPHFLTIGYLARGNHPSRKGALRGPAVRVVHPAIRTKVGFPPLDEALERLEMYRWVLYLDDN